MGCIFIKPTIISSSNINGLKLPRKNKYTVLYLEDAEIHYDLLLFIFKKYINPNVNIIWKTTINDGYNYLENNEIDLIIIDRILKNNEMGDDMINKIKENNIFDLSKVIIISAINKIEDIQKFIDMGIFYFKKPLDTNEFIHSMKKIF